MPSPGIPNVEVTNAVVISQEQRFAIRGWWEKVGD